jgi:hypothetical protein
MLDEYWVRSGDAELKPLVSRLHIQRAGSTVAPDYLETEYDREEGNDGRTDSLEPMQGIIYLVVRSTLELFVRQQKI